MCTSIKAVGGIYVEEFSNRYKYIDVINKIHKEKGRYGEGIYLWEEMKFAETLAQSDAKLQKGSSMAGSMVTYRCKVKIEKDALIDFEDYDTLDKVYDTLVLIGDAGIDISTEEGVKVAFEIYITQAKESLKEEHIVIIGRVAPPDKDCFGKYPIKVYGAPRQIMTLNSANIKVEGEDAITIL